MEKERFTSKDACWTGNVAKWVDAVTVIGGVKEKRYDGKIYHQWQAFSTKSRAEIEAKRLRKEGNLARIFATKYWYVVYRRKV